MAKKDIDIYLQAHDKATKKFGRVGKSANRLSSQFKKLAGAAAAYVGTRQLLSFAQESIQLFGVQEKAEKNLATAMKLAGDTAKDSLEDMKAFASGIQQITTIGDETVLQLAGLGASMAKLTGGELQRATKAAIGLSKAYGVDLNGAMRLVARAAVGDTATLKRYGITLDATLTPQEKFNELLKIGAENFKLAEAEADTLTGQMEQLGNAWGDLKEVIGGKIAGFGKDILEDWAYVLKGEAGRNKNRLEVVLARMKELTPDADKFMWDNKKYAKMMRENAREIVETGSGIESFYWERDLEELKNVLREKKRVREQDAAGQAAYIKEQKRQSTLAAVQKIRDQVGMTPREKELAKLREWRKKTQKELGIGDSGQAWQQLQLAYLEKMDQINDKYADKERERQKALADEKKRIAQEELQAKRSLEDELFRATHTRLEAERRDIKRWAEEMRQKYPEYAGRITAAEKAKLAGLTPGEPKGAGPTAPRGFNPLVSRFMRAPAGTSTVAMSPEAKATQEVAKEVKKQTKILDYLATNGKNMNKLISDIKKIGHFLGTAEIKK